MRGSKLSTAGWITLTILMALLGVSFWYSVKAWTAMPSVQMSGFGWFSLVLGVTVTIGLGVGLMGLVFYSARHDMDH